MQEITQKICKKCVCDTTISNIHFDENGVCNFCHIQEEMERQYPSPNSLEAKKELKEIIAKIKESGKGKKYNCVVGVSGGRDSSFLLYTAVKLGLKPLAVHFDNGWNSSIAVNNIKNILDILKVDLETLVVDWDEFKDLQRSFLYASVSDAEIPTDVGIFGTLNKIAGEENIKYILNGHSFRTEGIMPLDWTYMDGKYIKSIQEKFGTKKLKTFPNFFLTDMIYYTFIKNIKTVPLLNYVSYERADVDKILKEKLHWVYSGGHHHESFFTHFFQSYYLPQKFKLDKRKIEYSALIRSGQLKREKALKEIQEKTYEYDQELVNYTVSKIGFTPKEFEKIMKSPRKTFRDYPNYYSMIKFFKIPLKIASNLGIIPKILYQKFFS